MESEIMMMHYEKPDILRVDNLSEGVYLASGQFVCGSKYLQGNWIKPWQQSSGDIMHVRGCEGCSADDGAKCKISVGDTSQLNANGDFRPTWEIDGKKPEDPPYYN